MSHKWLDETSAKAFRAAKLRHAFIIGAIITVFLLCVSGIMYQQHKKNKLKQIAKEYAEIDLQYYQETMKISETQSDAFKPTADHSKSMDAFAQFAKKYSNEPYGWQAAIRASTYDINQGNLQVAKELFEIIIPYTTKYTLLQVQVRMALASILAEQNNVPDAMKQMDIINKIGNNPISDQTKLFQAQLLDVDGKTDQARQLLNTLSTEQSKIWLSFIES